MNDELMQEFTMEDVDAALSQMHPLKSPGPDGFSACFYQRSWATLRADVGKAVLDFLNFCVFYSSLNITHIVLVPKIKNSSRITEYRPISLCNVVYKFNCTRQLHESIVVMWLCKCECQTHRESALSKTNFKTLKLIKP
jgi:hypothetical protein